MNFWKMNSSLKNSSVSRFVGIFFIIAFIAVGILYYSMRVPNNVLLFGNQASSTIIDIKIATSVPALKSKVNALPNNSSRKLSSVVAVANRLSNTSQFNSLFKSTGVGAKITDAGPYTIFVPTNTAFGQLPSGTIAKMTIAQKLRFIEYHVVSGRAIDPKAQVAGTIRSLSGDMLNFTYGADKIPLVNSAIFIKEYPANNGVVYLIDNVLLPPQR